MTIHVAIHEGEGEMGGGGGGGGERREEAKPSIMIMTKSGNSLHVQVKLNKVIVYNSLS